MKYEHQSPSPGKQKCILEVKEWVQQDKHHVKLNLHINIEDEEQVTRQSNDQDQWSNISTAPSLSFSLIVISLIEEEKY